jgi:hypothetical protein
MFSGRTENLLTFDFYLQNNRVAFSGCMGGAKIPYASEEENELPAEDCPLAYSFINFYLK